MIWDRFDDAMGDLDRDARTAKAEIERLEAEFKALGVEVAPDLRTQAASRPYEGPQSRYLERGDEVSTVESRRDALRVLVDARRAQRARRRMFLRAGIGATAAVALGAGGTWVWLNRRHTPRAMRGLPLRLELMPARNPPDERDLNLMVTLAVIIDVQPTIAVVAGNGGRLLHPDATQRAETSARSVCAIRWGESDRLEVSLWPVGGAEYWRETYLRAPGENEIALARRAAAGVVRNVRPKN